MNEALKKKIWNQKWIRMEADKTVSRPRNAAENEQRKQESHVPRHVIGPR